MSTVDPIQGNHSTKPVNNYEQSQNYVSKSKRKEKQLQYDEAEEISLEELTEAIAKGNEYILGVNAHFQYRIHEGTERIMVKLVNTQSNEVIREIPPEKMLDLVADIWKQVGLVIDKVE